jgi:hypothetical protein
MDVTSLIKGKRPQMIDQSLYVFLDEGGNFDFTAGGTPYFLLTSIVKERPFAAYQDTTGLKYDLIETGANIEYFHAAEDAQATRNRMFDVIERRLKGVRIDSLIIEKRKTGPALQHPEKFYPKMLGYLLRHVLERHHLDRYREVLVFTDRIPVARNVTQSKKLPECPWPICFRKPLVIGFSTTIPNPTLTSRSQTTAIGRSTGNGIGGTIALTAGYRTPFTASLTFSAQARGSTTEYLKSDHPGYPACTGRVPWALVTGVEPL